MSAAPVAPIAGFCIKLTTRANELYFVNVCSHNAVDRPIDAKDEPVSDAHIDARGVDNLRVPLLTGPLRTIALGEGDAEAYVMDVVFNPCVVTPALPQEEPPHGDALAQRRVQLGRAVRSTLRRLSLRVMPEPPVWMRARCRKMSPVWQSVHS